MTTRATLEIVAAHAATGPVVVLESDIPGVCIVACHDDDEADVLAAIEDYRPAGVLFVTVRDYPAHLRDHARAEKRCAKLRGPFRRFWRLFYRFVR
jgi:hypothetical protein